MGETDGQRDFKVGILFQWNPYLTAESRFKVDMLNGAERDTDL